MQSEIHAVFIIPPKVNGELETVNNVIPFNRGTIVFVPRNTPCSFYNVTVSVSAIGFTSLEDKSKGDTNSLVFSLDQLRASRMPDKNVFNTFFEHKSTLLGLYMLPERLKGDSAVYVHRFDEVNLITNSTGKLLVGKKNLTVKPGDIIYVRRGSGHSFDSLKQDLDVLIFFEKELIQK